MNYISIVFHWLIATLPKLRRPKNFFLIILPFSLLLGRLASDYSVLLNEISDGLINLIAFPAIPLVLSAVMVSIANIFSVEERSKPDRFKFASRFGVALTCVVLFVSILALLLSIYQSPGILSPEGRLNIGRFMLDELDIRIGGSIVESEPTYWFDSIIPTNILFDASNNNTLKVISGSIIAGLAMSRLSSEKVKPLINLLRSINSISVQVLNIVLNLAPLVLIFVIASAVTKINSQIIFTLLNFSICVFFTAVISLGISRLIFKRFTNRNERLLFTTNPIDKIFLLALSTGSSMSAYSLIFDTLMKLRRDQAEVEASVSLSLLVARLGNVTYNVIAIMFALNLYEVQLNPLIMIEVLLFGIATGFSTAGLTGVTTIPTISLALSSFQVPAQPVIPLLMVIDPILSLPRAATTAVLATAIGLIASVGSTRAGETVDAGEQIHPIGLDPGIIGAD